MRKTTAQKGNPELIQALTEIEKEKDIDKEILFEAIENSLLAACKNQYGKADNVRVILDRKTGEFHVYLDKEVVEEVEDEATQISITEARVRYSGQDRRRYDRSGSNTKELWPYCSSESKTGCCSEDPGRRKKSLV